MKFIRMSVLALALMFVHYARTTDYVLTYTWMWVSTPGVYPGGFWSLIAVDPYVPGA